MAPTGEPLPRHANPPRGLCIYTGSRPAPVAALGCTRRVPAHNATHLHTCREAVEADKSSPTTVLSEGSEGSGSVCEAKGAGSDADQKEATADERGSVEAEDATAWLCERAAGRGLGWGS